MPSMSLAFSSINTSAYQAQRLQKVRPHDGFDAADTRVEPYQQQRHQHDDHERHMERATANRELGVERVLLEDEADEIEACCGSCQF